MRYLTAGESHGKALLGIIEGLPAGIPVILEELNLQMKRRKKGYGRSERQKIEADTVQILSGVRNYKTLGTPIALMIENRDFENWQDILSIQTVHEPEKKAVFVPRPGHADLAGSIKFGHTDMRNVLERASARETAMKVALGSFARFFLAQCDIYVTSRVTQIGSIVDTSKPFQDADGTKLKTITQKIDDSLVRMWDTTSTQKAIQLIEETKQKKDTLGGAFEVIAIGVPIGLGNYCQADLKLTARIGSAFLGLNAIKAVAIGSGFECAQHFGSTYHDPYCYQNGIKPISNNAGGITGGISTGQTIIVQAKMKPLSTLAAGLPSVHIHTKKPAQAHVERSDITAVASASVIAESLLCLVLSECILEKFGGDSLAEILPRLHAWKK